MSLVGTTENNTLMENIMLLITFYSTRTSGLTVLFNGEPEQVKCTIQKRILFSQKNINVIIIVIVVVVQYSTSRIHQV